MSDEDLNNQVFFNDFKSKIENLNGHLKNINNNLENEKIELISYGKGNGSLGKLFTINPDGVGALGPVDGFIQQSLEIVNNIEKFTNNYNLSWEVEQRKKKDIFENKIERDKITRKAERRDMWSLWAQKLVRWSLGAAAAVILYSTVVWAASQCDFIKVPIKDWIPKQSLTQ